MRHRKDKNLLGNYFKSILIFFISLLIIFLLFKNPFFHLSEQRLDVTSDSIFNKPFVETDKFKYLSFEMSKDYVLKKIDFISINEKVVYTIDTKLYVLYDGDYYRLDNIINVIKQKRSESASINFLFFLQAITGIKVNNYIYKFDVESQYHTNNTSLDWNFIKKDFSPYSNADLNKKMIIIYKGNSFEVYDNDQNDKIIRSFIRVPYNINIELYNSTPIDKFGAAMSRLLENEGFSVVRTLSYDKPLPKTVLYINSKEYTDYSVMENLLDIDNISSNIPADITSIADFIIILGGNSIYLY